LASALVEQVEEEIAVAPAEPKLVVVVQVAVGTVDAMPFHPQSPPAIRRGNRQYRDLHDTKLQ
jgi:hypothetical protein